MLKSCFVALTSDISCFSFSGLLCSNHAYFYFVGRGGLANSKPSPSPMVSGLQRDTSQVNTLTELGKKLLEAAKVGDANRVRRLMAVGAPFASDGVCILLWLLGFTCVK